MSPVQKIQILLKIPFEIQFLTILYFFINQASSKLIKLTKKISRWSKVIYLYETNSKE